MLTAGMMMTRNVITVGPETPVLEAARLLIENQISGLPVVDETQTLCGILTEKDLLGILVEKDIKSKVADFMTKRVVVFKENNTAVEVCKYLMQTNIRRVPIVSEDGKIVGIVSRRDIISKILDLRSAGE